MSNYISKIEQKVNDAVIAGLKAKGLNWFKPWRGADGAICHPLNWNTGRAYRGTNVWLLNAVMMAEGYEHNEWLTAKQGYAAGGTNKGEKGWPVIFWQSGFKVKMADGNWRFFKANERAKAEKFAASQGSSVEKTLTLREFTVFNIGQFKGLEPKGTSEPVTVGEPEFTPVEKAEVVLRDWADKPEIRHNGNQAYYSPSQDFINMPDPTAFVDSDSYYKVLFHESIHATGHKSRLNRFKEEAANAAFGSKEYSREELTAEIGCLYLSEVCDLDPKDNEENSQAYINGWVKHLEDHPKECIQAMQRASKATAHILGQS